MSNKESEKSFLQMTARGDIRAAYKNISCGAKNPAALSIAAVHIFKFKNGTF